MSEPLTKFEKETLFAVLQVGRMGWFRARSSGERVTLASLHRKRFLERRPHRGKEGERDAAYEYQPSELVASTWAAALAKPGAAPAATPTPTSPPSPRSRRPSRRRGSGKTGA